MVILLVPFRVTVCEPAVAIAVAVVIVTFCPLIEAELLVAPLVRVTATSLLVTPDKLKVPLLAKVISIAPPTGIEVAVVKTTV